jgi:hypothetical protein
MPLTLELTLHEAQQKHYKNLNICRSQGVGVGGILHLFFKTRKNLKPIKYFPLLRPTLKEDT